MRWPGQAKRLPYRRRRHASVQYIITVVETKAQFPLYGKIYLLLRVNIPLFYAENHDVREHLFID